MQIYDTVIIGAGTAGLAALREVRKRTEDFVIVNAGPYGTTCARVGCMPSKALIEAANAFHRRHALAELGIQHGEQLHIDIPAVLQRVRELRDHFVAGILPLTQQLGPRSIAGRARFVAPDTIEVDGRRLRGRTLIIATGSTPVVPEAWSALGHRVLTSDSLFEQPDLPRTMGVVGLGTLGVEMAQALARLGIRVVACGRGALIGGFTDPAVSDVMRRALSDEMTVRTGVSADVQLRDEKLLLCAGDEHFEVDAVLAALGRRPNVAGLGIERLGVECDARGVPKFDPRTLQIGELPVFIAGDVGGAHGTLHEANDDGHIAGVNGASGAQVRFRRRVPLGIVFSAPNIAQVGVRWQDLDATQIVVGRVDYGRQGRAHIALENCGALHVYVRRADARILGAELAAPRGEHLAQLLAFAIARESTVHDMLGMPFYHPVFEEGLRTALRDAARQLDVRRDSDLARCDAVGAEALD